MVKSTLTPAVYASVTEELYQLAYNFHLFISLDL